MLDLEKLQREYTALPGTVVTATKSQLDLLVEEARQGQIARMRLAELNAALRCGRAAA